MAPMLLVGLMDTLSLVLGLDCVIGALLRQSDFFFSGALLLVVGFLRLVGLFGWALLLLLGLFCGTCSGGLWFEGALFEQVMGGRQP
jgi:hypothetical protein